MIELPEWSGPLFSPNRYKVLAGGRGSAKSESVGRALLISGYEKKERVLCGREFQNSIQESVHYTLKKIIESDPLLSAHYKTNNNSVYSEINGTEFFFKGIRHNIESIKSMSGITKVWLEEAATISKTSWDILVPTIREPGSEIWVTFNPEDEDDPTYAMFFDKNGNVIPREDAFVMKVNWDMNPWFPDVLKSEKDHLYRVNPDLADHVWGGNCRKNSDSQIFKNKYVIREFEYQSHFSGPYFGADFGFSQDPSTLLKMYVDTRTRELLIRNAKFGYGIEIDDLHKMYEEVPESKQYLIRADCARPETISYLSRQGFIIEGCEKWKGCVEDGIEWMKGFDKIVIHPECSDMITEAKKYSYKVDRLSQDILTDIVDAYNHGWDAARYGLQPLIQAGGVSTFDVL